MPKNEGHPSQHSLGSACLARARDNAPGKFWMRLGVRRRKRASSYRPRALHWQTEKECKRGGQSELFLLSYYKQKGDACNLRRVPECSLNSFKKRAAQHIFAHSQKVDEERIEALPHNMGSAENQQKVTGSKRCNA